MSSGEEEETGVSLKRAGSVRELRARFEAGGSTSPPGSGHLGVWSPPRSRSSVVTAWLQGRRSSGDHLKPDAEVFSSTLPSPRPKKKAPARKLRSDWTKSMSDETHVTHFQCNGSRNNDVEINQVLVSGQDSMEKISSEARGQEVYVPHKGKDDVPEASDSGTGETEIMAHEDASVNSFSSSDCLSNQDPESSLSTKSDCQKNMEEIQHNSSKYPASIGVPTAPESSSKGNGDVSTRENTAPSKPCNGHLANSEQTKELQNGECDTADDGTCTHTEIPDLMINDQVSDLKESLSTDTEKESERTVQVSLLRNPSRRQSKPPPLTVTMPNSLKLLVDEDNKTRKDTDIESTDDGEVPSPVQDGQYSSSHDLGSAIKHLKKELGEMRKQDIALLKQMRQMERILQEIHNMRMCQSRSVPSWTMTLPSPVRTRTFASVTADIGHVTWSMGSDGSEAGSHLTRCNSQTSGGSPSSEDEVLVSGSSFRSNKSFSVPHGPLQDSIRE